MAEQRLKPQADLEGAPQFLEMKQLAAPDRIASPMPFPSLRALRADRSLTVATPDSRAGEEIPEGHLRAAAYRREAIYRRALALADVVAAGIAVLIGVPILGQDALNPAALLALPLVLVVGKITGLYDRDENLIRKTTLDEVPTLFWVATLYALLIWLAGNLIVQGEFGRDQAVGVWGLLFVGMVAMRAGARQAARASSGEERCLVLGDTATANWISRRFAETAGLKARVICRAPLPLEGEANGRPELNGNGHANLLNGNGDANLDDGGLAGLVMSNQIERVIIASRAASSDDVLNTTRRLKSMGVRVSVLPRLPEIVGASVELDDVDGVTLLGMHRFGLTHSSGAVKRGFDFVGSGVGLILLSPFLAAIAITIKLNSRGPVLFRQRRMGRNGVPFEMLKFRTMVDGADGQKAALSTRNEADGGLFKIKDDPRITRVGNGLRRFSLDELPQLINVLRGEMSLVGPRPLVLDEDCRIEGWQRSRLELPPGMTGPWQVFGSARIPLNEMVKIDYLYGAKWSLWLDVKTLLRTVAFVLGRRGL
jgi:exopolysaccharide biosynthesis polyprenyl glycosylphosphotransferase